MSQAFRVEHDFLGDKQIPAAAWWGVHTARAVENFPISGTSVSVMPDLIRAFGFVKKAAARANAELGVLDRKRSAAIMSACEKLIAGHFRDQFVVDVIQGGAGTSTNMNANEVIANLALDKLGFEKGRYDILHPNDHVNASQSTNDVYPTAVRLALWSGIDRLLGSMATLVPRLPGQGGRIQGRAEDWPDPTAGRRAHDPGAGVLHLCCHD
jgi:aspartate ammonia-lyase